MDDEWLQAASASDTIPPEEVKGSHLEDDNPDHQLIQRRQTVVRWTPGGDYIFKEHFFWRYLDYKFKKDQWQCWPQRNLYEDAVGTEQFLRNLTDAGLIIPYQDRMTMNPVYPGEQIRQITCKVVRADDRRNKVKAEDPDFAYSGRVVCHGIHVMALTAVLEAGRLKGSRERGQEFSVPGLYTCAGGDTTP